MDDGRACKLHLLEPPLLSLLEGSGFLHFFLLLMVGFPLATEYEVAVVGTNLEVAADLGSYLDSPCPSIVILSGTFW